MTVHCIGQSVVGAVVSFAFWFAINSCRDEASILCCNLILPTIHHVHDYFMVLYSLQKPRLVGWLRMNAGEQTGVMVGRFFLCSCVQSNWPIVKIWAWCAISYHWQKPMWSLCLDSIDVGNCSFFITSDHCCINNWPRLASFINILVPAWTWIPYFAFWVQHPCNVMVCFYL